MHQSASPTRAIEPPKYVSLSGLTETRDQARKPDVRPKLHKCQAGKPDVQAPRQTPKTAYNKLNPIRSPPRSLCQVIPTGQPSNTRRRPSTPSAASTGASWPRRLSWPPSMAAATRTRIFASAMPTMTPRPTACPRTISSGRSSRAPASWRATTWRRSFMRAPQAAWPWFAKSSPTTAIAPRGNPQALRAFRRQAWHHELRLVDVREQGPVPRARRIDR